MARSHIDLRIRLALVASVLVCVTACRTPFDPIPGEQDIRRTVGAAIERELLDLPRPDAPVTTTAPPSPVEQALAPRREELEAMSPAPGEQVRTQDLGPDLAGAEHREVAMSLREAVMAAVSHNLTVAGSRLQPAIREADVIAAEAAFDMVFFTSAEAERVRVPTPLPVIFGQTLGTGVSATDHLRFETGVRQPLIIGGEVFASTDFSRTRQRAPGFTQFPDPAYAAALRLGYVQPLLRGFGTDMNRATIRIARNLQRIAVEELRLDFMQLIAETESAYWSLVFAWRDFEIQQWLLAEGIGVRDVLERRMDFDIRLAEYADAVSVVEQRRAEVIRARHAVRAASDRLKFLMNDPELAIATEIVLAPSDVSIGEPVTYSFRDTLLTALANRPEIQQAILRVDDARIREQVADNLRLPQLNLLAQLALSGLDQSVGRAYSEAFEADFVGYLLALAFEAPIGNREAESLFRQARLQRSAAMIAWRQTAQSVILDVKNALRDVVTNFELVEASRSFRIAQAENLRALLVREELVGMTPEFLNLKFVRQETLARARQQEILAKVQFDQAVARLHRAMGVGLATHQIDLQYAEPSFRD